MTPTPLPFRNPIGYTFSGHFSRPAAGWLRLALFGILLLFALLLIHRTWVGLSSLRQLAEENAEWRAALERARAHQGSGEASRHNSLLQSMTVDERRGLNRSISALNTPWPAAFAALEARTPSQVALIAIEPEGPNGLGIQAEARSLETLLAYAASLQGQGPFNALSYSRHELNERDPSRPFRLSFRLTLEARP